MSMNDVKKSQVLCNSFREKINDALKQIVGSLLYKVEFTNSRNEVLLLFKLPESTAFKVIKLQNCYAFKDFGIYDMPIELALIKEPTHLFREYCRANSIDFQFAHQLEIYPQKFKRVTDENLTYRTFFAICEHVELFSMSEIDF